MDVHQLRIQEYDEHLITNKIEALRSIEINLTDACNRSCVFCPQSVRAWSKKGAQFSAELAAHLNTSLRNIDYNGQISLTGFGEPALHRNLPDIARIISNGVELGWLEVNTNGDMLTRNLGLELIDAGVTHFTISLYDADTSDTFRERFADQRVELSFKHYYNPENTSMFINRVEQASGIEPLRITRRCNYPFYRLMIDVDGSVLMCSNDWNRSTNMGNITEETLEEIWLNDKFSQYREMLHNGLRDVSPCEGCNINGLVYGEQSYKQFYD